MMSTAFSSDQFDALREITNVAMGQAGNKLARLLDEFIELSVPRVQILPARELTPALEAILGGNIAVTGVRQAFHDGLNGEVVLLFADAGLQELASVLGADATSDEEGATELLLDLSNILAGACLCGIAEQLHVELGFSPPSILAKSVSIAQLVQAFGAEKHGLLLQIDFSLRAKAFRCHLLSLMAEADIRTMQECVDRFLESL